MKSEQTEFNHRYVAYAAAHGRTPAEQLNRDHHKMHEYIIWIQAQWRRWGLETGERPDWGGLTWSDRQNRAFDSWLQATYCAGLAETGTE